MEIGQLLITLLCLLLIRPNLTADVHPPPTLQPHQPRKYLTSSKLLPKKHTTSHNRNHLQKLANDSQTSKIMLFTIYNPTFSNPFNNQNTHQQTLPHLHPSPSIVGPCDSHGMYRAATLQRCHPSLLRRPRLRRHHGLRLLHRMPRDGGTLLGGKTGWTVLRSGEKHWFGWFWGSFGG